MANRDIDDRQLSAFRSPDYNESNEESHIAHMATYTSSVPVGDYAYPMHNSMLAYDTANEGNSVSVSLGSESAFSYDFATYPLPTTALNHDLNQFASLHSHAPGPDNASTYSSAQRQYWAQPHTSGSMVPSTQTLLSRPAQPSRAAVPSAGQKLPPGQLQDTNPFPQTSVSATSHRPIQPKSMTGKGPRSEASRSSTPYPNIYSRSGYDMMGILAEVVSRDNPRIDLGPVDLSCAFVLCDLTMEDSPIVYVSQAFERLTGYNEREIVGRNCRFLQSPDAKVEKGEPRKFVDSHTVSRLRSAVDQRSEIQVSVINYRKGGQPFLNLVTMIPVRWNAKDYYVGFQVDLVERPEAVTRRNPDGTYMIDYHRSQLPAYVVPAADMYRDDRVPTAMLSPRQVSVILNDFVRGQSVAVDLFHHMLVENTDDLIFVLSFEGEFLYLSPSCQTVLEYKPNDLRGKTLSAICHPSDIGPVTRDMRTCTTGDPISILYRIRRKESGYTWFENHGGWHITQRGRQFMVLVGRLIPMYSPIQLSNVESSGLAENDIWAKLSLSGIILFMSSKSRAVLGRRSDDLIGKRLQDFLVSDNFHSEPAVQQALETSRHNQQATFTHKIRHRKGHIISAQITLYPGDIVYGGSKPAFLIAHLRFPKELQLQASTTEDQSNSQSQSQTSSDTGPGDYKPPQPQQQTAESHQKPHPNFPQPPTSSATLAVPSSASPNSTEPPTELGMHLFEELNPTRGSNWHFELRELEKQNRHLTDEAQRLLARRRKRKRKQSAAVMEKSCAMCGTRTTPEWRRGPSGNRDLCNSCGLRWAKQVRSANATHSQGKSAGVG
ncbi:GATA transcription factor LreA [Aspergillus foveolatus]|uniref:GATA transcription factor LreA n=1 Tax=Aspergillus foveolatus TaxID=210207 RepID=UPI003CCD3636